MYQHIYLKPKYHISRDFEWIKESDTPSPNLQIGWCAPAVGTNSFSWLSKKIGVKMECTFRGGSQFQKKSTNPLKNFFLVLIGFHILQKKLNFLKNFFSFLIGLQFLQKNYKSSWEILFIFN